jgi:hypothetical protein
MATLVAVGAVARFAFGELATITPMPFYGVVIKVGLTETLAFIMGFVYGAAVGFVGGALIIVISDLMVLPGPWTPFIAAIIGVVFGVGAGTIRRFVTSPPKTSLLGASAVTLTVVSEFLQNWWVSAFYGIPLADSMISGIPSLITALVNNTILFTAIGPKVISAVQEQGTIS